MTIIMLSPRQFFLYSIKIIKNLEQYCPIELLRKIGISVSILSNVVATSYTWPLCTRDVAGTAE